MARIIYESLKPAPDNHPYLVRKNVRNYLLRINSETGDLAVPLKNINGQVVSIQWIPADPEAHKRFYEAASLKGTFFSIDLFTYDKSYDGIILIGEGYATMAKVYELTSLPVVAAIGGLP